MPKSNQTTEGGASHQGTVHDTSHGAPSSDLSSGNGASHAVPTSNQTKEYGASYGTSNSDQNKGNGASHGAPFSFEFPAHDIRLLDSENKTVLPCEHLVHIEKLVHNMVNLPIVKVENSIQWLSYSGISLT